MLLDSPKRKFLDRLGVRSKVTARAQGKPGTGRQDPSKWVPQSPAQQSAYEHALAQFQDRKDADASAREVASIVAVKERVEQAVAQLPQLRKTDPKRAARIEAMLPAFNKSLLAKDVYFGDSIPELLPPGVKRLGPDELEEAGLDPDDLQDPDSGYCASVYVDASTGEYTLANRGTANKKNMKTDALQAMGRGDKAYDEAIEAARKLKLAVGATHPVSATGHSLGGGEAMAQALVAGIPCTVFNAAGVHRNTLAAYDADFSQADTLVTAYDVKGEVLNLLQDAAPGVPDVKGERINLPAVEAPSQGPEGVEMGARMGKLETATHTVSLHYMQNVIYSMATEMLDDEAPP